MFSVRSVTWFYQLIYPSLAILALLGSDAVVAAVYLTLSMALAGTFFYACISINILIS